MCSAEECTVPDYGPQTIKAAAGVEGARSVSLTLCPACDYLRCRGCKKPILDRKAVTCPGCRRPVNKL